MKLPGYSPSRTRFDFVRVEPSRVAAAYPDACRLTLRTGGHYAQVTRAEEFNRFVEGMLTADTLTVDRRDTKLEEHPNQ